MFTIELESGGVVALADDDAVKFIKCLVAENAKLRAALIDVEAYLSSEDGPIETLWENCDIGDYDDYQTEWPETLADVRNPSVDPAILGSGTKWPVINLYREVLAALRPEQPAVAPRPAGEEEYEEYEEWLNTVIQDGGEWCQNCATAWRILKADDTGSKRVIEACYGCDDEAFDIYGVEDDGP